MRKKRNLFQRLRHKLAVRRLERSLDNVNEAEFRRMIALDNWFQSVRLVPGDKVVVTFEDAYKVSVVEASTESNPEIKEFNELNL